jgi:glyoxylase-like metal-dependent hydrolase (beta-lactamase superfamily II)
LIQLLDLRHLGRPKVIASYLLEGPEPALVDCGPSTCVAELEAGLDRHGLALHDLRHLVLTHIHLDHAGAAGTLVRRNPKLRVHVSSVGAPHLVDPSRLERSARRLYGDEFDRLWGALEPVPEENVSVLDASVLGLEAWPTPGHASHHVAFLDEEGRCFSGDAAGARILPSDYIAPVAPPPDIDLEAWERTLDTIEARRPATLCLPHFGVVRDPEEHLVNMRRRLRVWAQRVRSGATEEEFERAAEEEIAGLADEDTLATYKQAAPFWQSHAGLKRYWEKQSAASRTV